ncbi:MAG: RNA-binding S4 domain-containing protein [Gammaproteobacteria bacterium]
MSHTMRDVQITREPIELYKILKFEGLADNGGAAKALIEQGLVSVNGEVETRKRRQIVAGDVIGFAEEELRVVRAEASGESAPGPVRHGAMKKRARLGGR